MAHTGLALRWVVVVGVCGGGETATEPSAPGWSQRCRRLLYCSWLQRHRREGGRRQRTLLPRPRPAAAGKRSAMKPVSSGRGSKYLLHDVEDVDDEEEEAAGRSGSATCSDGAGVDASGAPGSLPLPAADPTAGFFNNMCFGWMWRHVLGARRGKPLGPDDVTMPVSDTVEKAYGTFEVHWQAELELAMQRPRRPSIAGDGSIRDSGSVWCFDDVAARCRGKVPAPSLLRALRRSFGWRYALAGVFKLGWSVFLIAGAAFFVRK